MNAETHLEKTRRHLSGRYFVVFFIYLIVFVLSVSLSLPCFGAILYQSSVRGGSVALSNLQVVNNWWGSTNATDTVTGNATIYTDSSLGWAWNRPNPQNYTGVSFVRPLYPSVMIGGSPNNASNSAYFPILYSSVQSLTMDLVWNYNIPPTGAYNYNLAYDIWFTSGSTLPSGGVSTSEVMVIFYQNYSPTVVGYTKVSGFNDGYQNYDLYYKDNGAGLGYFYVFMPTTLNYYATGLRTVNLKNLIDGLTLYNFSTNTYLNGIQFGDEVWGGYGDISIINYSLNLNGVKILDNVGWR